MADGKMWMTKCRWKTAAGKMQMEN